LQNNPHKHLTIKALANDDKPREKLMLKGRQALTDAELLGILLSSGNRNETAVQLAQRILTETNNSINSLAQLQLNDLKKFKGIGEAKAITILAALELGRRRTDSEPQQHIELSTSKRVYNYINPKLADLPHEEFWVIYLRRNLTVIKAECIARGGINQTTVDARLVFKPAIELLASAIVLAHNHPSGNVKPSPADVALTQNIITAGKLFNIEINDHIIIGNQNYFSFNENNLMTL
jgi:DNA repair protein RadC